MMSLGSLIEVDFGFVFPRYLFVVFGGFGIRVGPALKFGAHKFSESRAEG